MNWSATGAICLAVAVMLGAFGAHGLRARLEPTLFGIYEKAVFYHFVHALGLLIVSFLPRIGALPESAAWWVCALLLGGILVFSGSLYVLSVTGATILGAITPIGGLAFIAAWLMLGWALLRHKA